MHNQLFVNKLLQQKKLTQATQL